MLGCNLNRLNTTQSNEVCSLPETQPIIPSDELAGSLYWELPINPADALQSENQFKEKLRSLKK